MSAIVVIPAESLPVVSFHQVGPVCNTYQPVFSSRDPFFVGVYICCLTQAANFDRGLNFYLLSDRTQAANVDCGLNFYLLSDRTQPTSIAGSTSICCLIERRQPTSQPRFRVQLQRRQPTSQRLRVQLAPWTRCQQHTSSPEHTTCMIVAIVGLIGQAECQYQLVAGWLDNFFAAGIATIHHGASATSLVPHGLHFSAIRFV